MLNMKFQKRSRKHPKAGDIFVIHYVNNKYIYGKIIKDDAKPWKNSDDWYLIYFYNGLRDTIEPIPQLNKDNLIIPPDITNRQGWLKGYYLTVAHVPITPDDVREYHCFRRPPIVPGAPVRFFNEYAEETAERPIWADNGLASYSYIDLLISHALGIPHPEDDK